VALRLSHVLVLMALVLAAGVLSVQGLDEGNAVQGTLVIVVPGMTSSAARQLEQQRSDLRWTVLPAGARPLSPFDDELVAERIAQGTVASLFVQPPQPTRPSEASRKAWRVLIAPEHGDVLASLADFVRAQSGTRPFLAGLILPPSADCAALPALLEPLLAAADTLPSFRRTSVVLLGERQSDSGVRVVVRLDRGGDAPPAPVTLIDLLGAER
jgi:hypothetical protein